MAFRSRKSTTRPRSTSRRGSSVRRKSRSGNRRGASPRRASPRSGASSRPQTLKIVIQQEGTSVANPLSGGAQQAGPETKRARF